MLQVNVTGNTMIFRKDFDNKPNYSTTLSKKLMDGNYDNAYINVRFKKGVELENKTKIYVTNGWLTYWKNKEGKAVYEIFISEFEGGVPEGFAAITEEDCPF